MKSSLENTYSKVKGHFDALFFHPGVKARLLIRCHAVRESCRGDMRGEEGQERGDADDRSHGSGRFGVFCHERG
jgi:hypothetical protein